MLCPADTSHVKFKSDSGNGTKQYSFDLILWGLCHLPKISDSDTRSGSEEPEQLTENVNESQHIRASVRDTHATETHVLSGSDEETPPNLGICPFCDACITPSDESFNLTESGVATVQAASRQRGDDPGRFHGGQRVHHNCRKKYTNKKLIEAALKKKTEQTESISTPNLRAKTTTFDIKSDCIFCGKKLDDTSQNSKCLTIEIKDSLLKKCEERNDVWANRVKARLLAVHDLMAADALYHRQCSSNFRTNRNIPIMYQSEEQPSKKLKVGRPADTSANIAFEQVIKYLKENDDEQITVQDLVNYMESLLKDESAAAYSNVWMKKNCKNDLRMK